MTIYELADSTKAALVVMRRFPRMRKPWVAFLRGWEVEDVAPIVSNGAGATPDEAISNYVNNIRGRVLVPDRRVLHILRVPAVKVPTDLTA